MLLLLLSTFALQAADEGLDEFSQCMWSRVRAERARDTGPDRFDATAATACAAEERSFRSRLTRMLVAQGKPAREAEALAAQVAGELRHNVGVVYRRYSGF